jgi:hypothetical protein
MTLSDLKVMVDRLYDLQNTYGGGNLSDQIRVCVRDGEDVFPVDSVSLTLGVFYLNGVGHNKKVVTNGKSKSTVNNIRNKSNKDDNGKVS